MEPGGSRCKATDLLWGVF